MCLFLYRQCHTCRFPDSRSIALGQECVTFQQALANRTMPSVNDLYGEIGAEFSPLYMAGWKQQGSSLCRMLGEGWQIRPSRDCIMWSASPERWVCLVCEVIEKAERRGKMRMPTVEGRSDRSIQRGAAGLSHTGTTPQFSESWDNFLGSFTMDPCGEDAVPDVDWSALVEWPFDDPAGGTYPGYGQN